MSISEKDGRRVIGPLCKCGHGLYEHYMCGSPQSARCLTGCGCKCFEPKS